MLGDLIGGLMGPAAAAKAAKAQHQASMLAYQQQSGMLNGLQQASLFQQAQLLGYAQQWNALAEQTPRQIAPDYARKAREYAAIGKRQMERITFWAKIAKVWPLGFIVDLIVEMLVLDLTETVDEVDRLLALTDA